MAIYQDQYQPYFYIIQDVRNGMYYAGSRYSKKAKPSELLTENGYKTHSKKVKWVIKEHGLKSFVIRKIRTFESAEQAYDYETRFLQKVDARNHHKFYNGHNNDGVGISDPKHRKVLGPDGLTSYQRGARKGVETRRNTIIDGMNMLQIAYYKALDNQPNLHEIRTENMIKTNSVIDPRTGLNKFQENGKKILGENNPSKKPENAKKISEGMKRFIKNNPDKWKKQQEMMNKKRETEKDESGLTVSDRHSIWMLENNPTTGSKWYNNGSKNKRVKDGEHIPSGFVEGRLPMKKLAPSRYYNNGERNIRVTDGKKVPDGFVLGKLMLNE